MTLSLAMLVFAAASVFAGVVLITFYRALVERAEAGGSGDDVAQGSGKVAADLLRFPL